MGKIFRKKQMCTNIKDKLQESEEERKGKDNRREGSEGCLGLRWRGIKSSEEKNRKKTFKSNVSEAFFKRDHGSTANFHYE